jgi:RNA polymerase sigma-70 factor (ECF subfamily)
MNDLAGEQAEAMDGETLAFDELVRRYQQKVFNVLLRMIGDYDEAADLTQDVFVQAFKALPHFRGESKVFTWLYRIAVNRCKNRLKQIARTNTVVTSSLDEPIDGEDALRREVPDETFAPEIHLERQELREVVIEEIYRLPPDFKLVIILRDLNGLSYKEMADAVGITLEAVKSRLFRARSLLRDRLRPYLHGLPPQAPPDGSSGPRRGPRPGGGAR